MLQVYYGVIALLAAIPLLVLLYQYYSYHRLTYEAQHLTRARNTLVKSSSNIVEDSSINNNPQDSQCADTAVLFYGPIGPGKDTATYWHHYLLSDPRQHSTQVFYYGPDKHENKNVTDVLLDGYFGTDDVVVSMEVYPEGIENTTQLLLSQNIAVTNGVLTKEGEKRGIDIDAVESLDVILSITRVVNLAIEYSNNFCKSKPFKNVMISTFNLVPHHHFRLPLIDKETVLFTIGSGLYTSGHRIHFTPFVYDFDGTERNIFESNFNHEIVFFSYALAESFVNNADNILALWKAKKVFPHIGTSLLALFEMAGAKKIAPYDMLMYHMLKGVGYEHHDARNWVEHLWEDGELIVVEN